MRWCECVESDGVTVIKTRVAVCSASNVRRSAATRVKGQIELIRSATETCDDIVAAEQLPSTEMVGTAVTGQLVCSGSAGQDVGAGICMESMDIIAVDRGAAGQWVAEARAA